jgi:hypothetical protein
MNLLTAIHLSPIGILSTISYETDRIKISSTSKDGRVISSEWPIALGIDCVGPSVESFHKAGYRVTVDPIDLIYAAIRAVENAQINAPPGFDYDANRLAGGHLERAMRHVREVKAALAYTGREQKAWAEECGLSLES